jgi:hypothetical protein
VYKRQDYLLLADDDPDRLSSKIKTKLVDQLLVVHSPEEVEAGEGMDGGFGRNGRALTCLISMYAKDRSGLDGEGEETALAIVDQMAEDARTELWPAGVPNLLTAYIYYAVLETEEGPQDAPEIGSGVYKSTLKLTGYKMEV